MEADKLRDEYIRIFEEKKKLEHDYLILLDKVPLLELSEKNYQEAFIQIESLNEKNKQMAEEILYLKERIHQLGIENAELMDANHHYCEAVASFNCESENSKYKNLIENTKIKKLEQDLANAYKKSLELEIQIDKLNNKRMKEIEERNYIEKRYEDIIYEQEYALANIVKDNDKSYKESLIEKLIIDNELSNRFNFTYNQTTDKIEIFFDDEKIIDIENNITNKTLKKFKSMNSIRYKNYDIIPKKTKNIIVSDLSFSYFESEESNDENNTKENFKNDINDFSTKEPSRPSITNSSNVNKLSYGNYCEQFKDINKPNSRFKKKNYSCQINQRIKNFLRYSPYMSNNNNFIDVLNYDRHNSLKTFLPDKSIKLNINNINESKNHFDIKMNIESNKLKLSDTKRTKRKSLSSSSLNKLMIDNYSQIKNDNSKLKSSFTNNERDLKKFFTPINLKHQENYLTQKSIKNKNNSINPQVTHFSLANTLNDKLVNLSNKGNNFKSKLSSAILKKNKTNTILSTIKNKLFDGENNNHNFVLENLLINQTIDNENNTEKYNIFESNNNAHNNIDNPLFKSTNSSFLNDTSFNANLIRRTTLDNFNIISSKLTSIANGYVNEANKKNANDTILKKEKEVSEIKSDNNSYSDCDSYKKNGNSKYFTLADKKFILEDLVEEEKSIKGFDNNDSHSETNGINLNTINISNIEENIKSDNKKDFIINNSEVKGKNFTFENINIFQNMKSPDDVNRNKCVIIENSINIQICGNNDLKNINSKSRNLDPIYEGDYQDSKQNLSKDKINNNNNKLHRKSLSNVDLTKLNLNNLFKQSEMKLKDNDLCKNNYKNKNINLNNEMKENVSIKNIENKEKESIFDRIRKDLILSCKKSDICYGHNNDYQTILDNKFHDCKKRSLCQKHIKIKRALNKNKSKNNYESLFLNTDFIKRPNLSIGINPIKSFHEEDNNLTYIYEENKKNNIINKLDLKSITIKDQKNLIHKQKRKSIANSSLKNEFLNELKLSKQNNNKEKFLKKESLKEKRLSTNITTNNHYWKYTINLLQSQDSSFINNPNSQRSDSKTNNKNLEDKNIHKNRSILSSEKINVSIISDCNPAILEENNYEQFDTFANKDLKFENEIKSSDLDNENIRSTPRGFSKIKMDSQINNFWIPSNIDYGISQNDDLNIKNNSCDKDITKKDKSKIKKKHIFYKNNEEDNENSIINKSDHENEKSYISSKEITNSVYNSPYKTKITYDTEDEQEFYEYNNSYRSRENLLNNAYVREKIFSSTSLQNNNLNFKINLDLKILGNER